MSVSKKSSVFIDDIIFRTYIASAIGFFVKRNAEISRYCSISRYHGCLDRLEIGRLGTERWLQHCHHINPILDFQERSVNSRMWLKFV